MPHFDPLTWATGYFSVKIANKVIEALSGSELSRALQNESKIWSKSLPEGYQITPEIFLLPSKDIANPEELLHLSTLQGKLSLEQIPSNDIWFNAFKEHRDEVRNRLKDQAHSFFKADDNQADIWLKDLSNRFHKMCAKPPPHFFQTTVIECLEQQYVRSGGDTLLNYCQKSDSPFVVLSQLL